MNSYKLYIRHKGKIINKYETAVNEFEAICKTLSLYKGAAIVKLIYLEVRHAQGNFGRGSAVTHS